MAILGTVSYWDLYWQSFGNQDSPVAISNYRAESRPDNARAPVHKTHVFNHNITDT